jgi:acyl-CoA synthetase (AMP-forming)/AMP-acid ligase II
MSTTEIPLRRLQQTAHHLLGTAPAKSNLSIVHGEQEPRLVSLTLGDLLDEQTVVRGSKECLVLPQTGVRWTYGELQTQSKNLAKGFLAQGIQAGDRIGILASNCEEYVAAFFAAGYLGCILVVLNGTYTASEAQYALNHSGEFKVHRSSYIFLQLTVSGCKLLFIEEKYGRHSNAQLLQEIGSRPQDSLVLKSLNQVITLRGSYPGFPTYEEVIDDGKSRISDDLFEDARLHVNTHDVCNLQYTSGSTGQPKAASLTHL